MNEVLPETFLAGLHQLGLESVGAGEGLSGEGTFMGPCLGDRYARMQETPTVILQFLRYRQELLDWNTRFNLTAITDPEEVLIKHFLDSLSLLIVYDRPGTRLLDIGAGAGFPGLPLKIVRPHWQVMLLEATGKKVTFLQHVIETLKFQNVVAVHGRAEELVHKPEYRAAFDVVTAR